MTLKFIWSFGIYSSISNFATLGSECLNSALLLLLLLFLLFLFVTLFIWFGLFSCSFCASSSDFFSASISKMGWQIQTLWKTNNYYNRNPLIRTIIYSWRRRIQTRTHTTHITHNTPTLKILVDWGDDWRRKKNFGTLTKWINTFFFEEFSVFHSLVSTNRIF
jgi:hypothetical protein